MARHVPDDFSFLPTVDSTDEDHVIKEELWPVKPPPAPEEPEPPHEEVVEPAYEPPAYEAPPQEDPEPPVRSPSVQKKVRVFEPDVSDHDHAPPGQGGRELWEAFQQEHGDAPTIIAPKTALPPEEVEPVVPRRATPKVSFSDKEEKKFTPAAPAPLNMPPVHEAKASPPPLPQDPAPVPEAGHVEEPVLNTGVAADPEAEPADNADQIKNAKKRALFMTLGVHVAVILIMLLMHVPMMDFTRPEIVATSAVEELENESWKKVTTAAPQTSPMAASISPLLSTGISDIAMPEVDFSATTSDLNLGTSFGSFGSGVTTGGAGGKVSFLGNTATAKHVVFVVDVSGSMSASMNVSGSGMMTRFDLLKKELNKSISALAAGTAYQVIFFSDFAWPHDVVDSNDMRALNAYDWKITPQSKNVSIPRFSYLASNPSNISKSKKIITEANNPGGTNWGSGLMMALKANPRPDVIFFMTDGNRSDEQGWIDVVTTENSRGKRTIIHTTAMGTPDAARDLDAMAKRNGGKFTAVMADGKIVQGKDLLR
ncbi:hypothetical protein [Prosthecobacter sp.]|uniref:hypothetical protein n=1 Tax=Prosthecobacter sp. TaxID=1965333 RepID=UPI001DE8F873|nr:hypothetical protein [Prosthecobacter sp.]MCB1275170.1 hypothetical protein [Prosthecobacter sp.]